MKTLLQDGLQAHMPAPPEKRLLINCLSIAGKTRWHGTVECSHGRVVGFGAFGLSRLGDRVRRCSDTTLRIVSTTAGNCNGVMLELDAPREGALRLTTEAFEVQFPLAEIGDAGRPSVVSRGSSEVRVRKLSKAPAPRAVSFACADAPPPGTNPYWVRLVQADGNEAWSSPIYLRGGCSSP